MSDTATPPPSITRDQAAAGRYFDGRAPIALELMRARDKRVLVDGPLGTGKSRMLLEKARACALRYPGIRILLLRKFRKWMTETVLVTWEQEVVEDGLLVPDKVQRSNRSSYTFKNGTSVVVAGLDDPQAVFSSQYDLILIFEAIENSQAVVEQVEARLRNNRMPYQQLLMDCNPSSPKHWLHVKFTAPPDPATGARWCRRLPMRHTDNPSFFTRTADGELETEVNEAGERVPKPTPRGRDYLDRLVTGLTGPRLLRLFKGLWVQAEGVVYDGWDAAVNETTRAAALPTGWEALDRIWAVDFGFNDPFSWGCWVRLPDDEWVLAREIYLTKLLITDAAAMVRAVTAADRPPLAVVCDHDRQERGVFERVTGYATVPALKTGSKNVNGIKFGIDMAASRIKPGANGRPRLRVCSDAMEHAPDAERRAAGQPTGLIDEIGAYQWKADPGGAGYVKDEPQDRDNHACDMMRYAVRWMEAFAAGAATEPPTAGTDAGPLGPGWQPADGRFGDVGGLNTTRDDLRLHDYRDLV